MSTGHRIILALGLFLILALVVIAVAALALSVAARGGFPFGGDRVALLRVEGLIDDTGRQVELARQYREDPSIRAIVVRVDSGGGAVGASQELFTELLRARGEKPVIASFGNVAASGGYYVALAADRIFANPGTVTGSIGVLMNHVDTSGLLRERLGLDFTTVTSRDNKDVGSTWDPLSEEDRALIEEMLVDVHDQFVAAVRGSRAEAIRAALAGAAEGREPADVTDAEIDARLEALCDGRPFTGQQAIAWGFVDDLGNLQDAIDHAASAAGIEGEPSVVEWKPRQGLFGPLVESAVRGIAGAVRDELTIASPLLYQMTGM